MEALLCIGRSQTSKQQLIGESQGEKNMPAYLGEKFLVEEEMCAVLVLVIWVNTIGTTSLFQMTHVF